MSSSDQPPDHRSGQSSEETTGQTTGQVVFVVDDDEAIRRALKRSLTLRGYNVVAFGSAELFLESFDPLQGGCLVLDMRMPGMSGLDLQQELVQRNASLPIIFVTGHGESQQVARAKENGAIDFLEKPYPVEQLFERIDNALGVDTDKFN